MAYTAAEGRQQLLDSLGEATDALALSVAMLTEAYELLDETTGDRLEEQLFRPVQAAYGRARRAHAEFSARHDVAPRSFAAQARGLPSSGVKAFVESAMDAVRDADEVLGTLQDSMLPAEVGDREVQTGIVEVRRMIGDLPARARELVRTLGR
jgi:hypothetical protein